MTTNSILIKPAEELGPVLSNRFEDGELRERIEAELAAGTKVDVSFEGVVAIAPSFADELFAKVPEDAVEDGRVRFVDLDDDLLAIARFVREGRGVPSAMPDRRDASAVRIGGQGFDHVVYDHEADVLAVSQRRRALRAGAAGVDS